MKNFKEASERIKARYSNGGPTASGVMINITGKQSVLSSHEGLKREAEICAYGMRMHNNFPAHIIKDARYNEYDLIMSEIRSSKTVEMLNNAYVKYIDFTMKQGWGAQYIIGGIMNNPEQNSRFGIDIDEIIKVVMDINYGKIPLSSLLLTYEAEEEKPSEVIHKLEDHTEEENQATGTDGTVSKTEAGISDDNKFEELKIKFDHITNIANRLKAGKSQKPLKDIKKLQFKLKEVREILTNIDQATCSSTDVGIISIAINSVCELEKFVEETVAAYNKEVENKQEQQSNPVDTQTPQDPLVNPMPNPASAAAQNIHGFSIGNFIRQDQQNIVKGPIFGNTQPQQQPKQTVFPHQICGLTEDQLIAEVGIHFSLIPKDKRDYTIDGNALYDLANNKILARKMKELGAKQRPNNPYLTQVNINEYIAEPELLQKFNLCFITPCKDKRYLIVVLFNPNPVLDKNGILNYPLHILKAKKTNNN